MKKFLILLFGILLGVVLSIAVGYAAIQNMQKQAEAPRELHGYIFWVEKV